MNFEKLTSFINNLAIVTKIIVEKYVTFIHESELTVDIASNYCIHGYESLEDKIIYDYNYEMLNTLISTHNVQPIFMVYLYTSSHSIYHGIGLINRTLTVSNIESNLFKYRSQLTITFVILIRCYIFKEYGNY